MAAGLGLEVLLIAIVDQRIEAVHAFRHHIAAAPTIPAIGPAELDKFFAPERHATGPAIAGADVDLGLVEEFHAADITRAPRVFKASLAFLCAAPSNWHKV